MMCAKAFIILDYHTLLCFPSHIHTLFTLSIQAGLFWQNKGFSYHIVCRITFPYNRIENYTNLTSLYLSTMKLTRH